MSIPRRDFVVGVMCGALLVDVTAASAAPTLNTVLPAKPFAQTKDWSCWAAAAAMMLQWKNNIPVSELDVARMAGPNYVIAFMNNTGLAGTEFVDFAKSLSLVTEAPQNYNPAGYHALLKAHGPLWVGARLDAGTQKSRRHIRVLRGIVGDGTFDGSTAWVLDPDGGRDYQESMTKFAMELETIAREEIGLGNALYPQIIRFP